MSIEISENSTNLEIPVPLPPAVRSSSTVPLTDEERAVIQDAWMEGRLAAVVLPSGVAIIEKKPWYSTTEIWLYRRDPDDEGSHDLCESPDAAERISKLRGEDIRRYRAREESRRAELERLEAERARIAQLPPEKAAAELYFKRARVNSEDVRACKRGTRKHLREMYSRRNERLNRRQQGHDPLAERPAGGAHLRAQIEARVAVAAAAAYERCSYRLGNGAGDRTFEVRIGAVPDATAEIVERWPSRGEVGKSYKWRIRDVTHVITVRLDWRKTVKNPIDEQGRLILAIEGERRLVVVQGRGCSIRAEWVS